MMDAYKNLQYMLVYTSLRGSNSLWFGINEFGSQNILPQMCPIKNEDLFLNCVLFGIKYSQHKCDAKIDKWNSNHCGVSSRVVLSVEVTISKSLLVATPCTFPHRHK